MVAPKSFVFNFVFLFCPSVFLFFFQVLKVLLKRAVVLQVATKLVVVVKVWAAVHVGGAASTKHVDTAVHVGARTRCAAAATAVLVSRVLQTTGVEFGRSFKFVCNVVRSRKTSM